MAEGHVPAARRPSALGRVLALGFGLVMALAVIEIAGRVALGFEPLPGWAQNFYSRAGYELRPHERYIYASRDGEFENEVRTNARGLHDVEHALEKPAGTFRILILSDSYGQAREVPLEANFARRLEAALNGSAPAGTIFEVINAGQFGLGTAQEYLYYTVEGRRYDPDLVLVGFYVGNDVVDNHAPLIKAWNNVETVDFPYFSPDGALHQPGMATGRRMLSWLRQNTTLGHLVARATGSSASADRVEVGGDDDVSAHALRVPMGVYLPPDATWADAWTATGHAFAALKRAVEADGARLGVFLIPDRRQVYDEEWDATLERLPDLDASALDRDRPTATALALLAAQDVPALSLLEPFRVAAERVYFPGDGHFTPAGHALTARLLASWLREANLIAEESAP